MVQKKHIRDVVLGIDIGGTYTKLGIVDKAGKIYASHVFKTGAKDPYALFMTGLRNEIQKLTSSLGSDSRLVATGIGAPNANYKTGDMEYPPNFRWGDKIPIKKDVQDILDLPTSITNDANAAALGELRFGIAQGMKNFVVLTLGTGLGSGIVSQGTLLTGEHGMAGELGHMNVVPNGRECNCGLTGCLETYASVTGIKRTVFELLAQLRNDSSLRAYSFDELTGKEISEAALQGDAIALRAFEKTAEILGCKMADTAAHLDPEAFILTGGLSQAGDILLDPVISNMEAQIFNAYRGKIKVMLSPSSSGEAVLGPAALAWESLDGKY